MSLFCICLGLALYVASSRLALAPPHPVPLTSSVLLFVIWLDNRAKEKQRVAHGKPAKIHNSSLAAKYKSDQDQTDSDGRVLGEQAFADLTDKQNDEVGPPCYVPS